MFNNNDNWCKRGLISISPRKLSAWLVVVSTLLLTSCATQTYEPERLEPQATFQQRVLATHSDPDFRTFLQQNNYPTSSWPLQQWDIAALTLSAFYFNPSMQVARSRIDVQRAGETIAGQRPNPTLNFPNEPRDTLDFFGLAGDFLFERSAKRQARQEQALAERQAAELSLAQHAWSLYAGIHADLIEYYASLRITELLSRQKEILEDSMNLLEQRLAAGQASEFELSSIRLELQRTELLIANQAYLRNDAFHQLIMNTGLQTDKFREVDFVFDELQQHLKLETGFVDTLQADMLHARFDIRQSLTEYNAFEARLQLEIEKQYPDITLSPGIIFEEGQTLWMLGASWVLPLFHNNDGQIQEALALRKQKQQEFIQLQSSLISELERKKQNYLDKLAAYEYSLQLLATLEARFKEIEKQFQFGYSDRLTVLRSNLEIEKAKQAMFSIEMDVMRAVIKLEVVTQSPSFTTLKELDFMQTQRPLEN